MPDKLERCTLSIRLKPASKHDAVVFFSDSAPLQVTVTAPPFENRANERCIALLAKRLGVPRSNLRIIKGGRCRDKVIACEGLPKREALNRLKGEK